MRLTAVHVEFWQSFQPVPAWVRGVQGAQAKARGRIGAADPPAIDAVVNANAGLRRMTDGELSTQNALNLLRGVRRREPSLLPYLDRVAANPGTVIKPEHRAALFRKWARRIRRGRP